MKKLSIFLAGLVAMFGFNGCSDDHDETVYHAPTTFEMNQPALADQYITLTPTGTFTLEAKAQPDYGYSAVTQYSAIVSLTPEFTETRELENLTPTQSRMSFSAEKLAVAICQLQGIENEKDWAELGTDTPVTKLYFKGVAQLKGIEGSRIVSSNYVTLNNVQYYFAIPTPGYIYLVGAPEGWAGPSASNAAHYEDWRLYEPASAIGSKVYVGVFDIPEGQAMFRFYTALTGWDADSYGSQADDNPVDCTMTDGLFRKELVKGKGSFNFPAWPGGKMTITVDMVNMTVTMQEGEQSVTVTKYVYMVGNNAGWAEPSEANAATYDPWRLADTNDDGVYEGRFDLTGFTADNGTLYCRFYEALAGWGAAQWSSDAAGGNVDAVLNTTMPTFAGEGCFVVAGVADKTLLVTLDTNANTVLFTLE